jgi:hypothetical protein
MQLFSVLQRPTMKNWEWAWEQGYSSASNREKQGIGLQIMI